MSRSFPAMRSGPTTFLAQPDRRAGDRPCRRGHRAAAGAAATRRDRPAHGPCARQRRTPNAWTRLVLRDVESPWASPGAPDARPRARLTCWQSPELVQRSRGAVDLRRWNDRSHTCFSSDPLVGAAFRSDGLASTGKRRSSTQQASQLDDRRGGVRGSARSAWKRRVRAAEVVAQGAESAVRRLRWRCTRSAASSGGLLRGRSGAARRGRATEKLPTS